jgi:hypothetical protein
LGLPSRGPASRILPAPRSEAIPGSQHTGFLHWAYEVLELSAVALVKRHERLAVMQVERTSVGRAAQCIFLEEYCFRR